MRKLKTMILTVHAQTENNDPYCACACANRKQWFILRMRKQKIAIPTVQCACANRKQQSLLRMCEQKTTFFTAHAQTENNYPYCATIPTAHAQTENNSLYCACINRKQLPYFVCVNRKQQYLLRMRKQKTTIPTAHAQTENKDPHCACKNSKQRSPLRMRRLTSRPWRLAGWSQRARASATSAQSSSQARAQSQRSGFSASSTRASVRAAKAPSWIRSTRLSVSFSFCRLERPGN